MLEGVLLAVGLLGVLGLLFGIGLVVAGRYFHVEEDPRVAQVAEQLPGANCGACGFSGCGTFARALIGGRAPANGCRAGGDTVAEGLARILGRSVEHSGRRVARVLCGGDAETAVTRAQYDGVRDCRAADALSGGPKACPNGCLGLGTCVTACPFGALAMGGNGLPQVDVERCTGCGLCEMVCPRGVIRVLPAAASYVRCVSTLPGKQVRQVCQAGCIGCRICERVCEDDAIHVVDNLASIDPAKCTSCGKCAEKCPTRCIEIVGPEAVPQAVPVSLSESRVSSETGASCH